MKFINYLGVWIVFCALDEFVIVFQERSYIMAWGAIAYATATFISEYVRKR